MSESRWLFADGPRQKPPCLYPLPDGRRCCECAACQGYTRSDQPCEHQNVTRVAPIYVDGRPLYKCDDCDVRFTYEDDKPTTCGLAPLRTAE